MTDEQRTQAVDLVLNDLLGEWAGTARTWFGPETLADESPIQGSFRRIGDSHFVLYEYNSAFQGTPLSGAAIYGYNQWSDSFEGAWVDSFHMSTNIMTSTGPGGAPDLNVNGSYAIGDGPRWGWRTTLARDGADRLILTAYNRKPDDVETKAVEVIYTRATSAR